MKRQLLSICLAIWFLAQGTHFAHAMSCDNRGAADRLHYGSNVQGDKVTICAEYWWPPTKTKTPPAPVKKAASVPQKVDPNFFVVSPLKPKALTSSPTRVEQNQEVYLFTSAVSHSRKNLLLGRLAIVRFSPIRTSWVFGDGSREIAKSLTHRFAHSGTFAVFANVSYSVRFRFVGSTKWVQEPRGITLQTNRISFKVSVPPQPAAMGRPHLVLFDCFGFQRKGC